MSDPTKDGMYDVTVDSVDEYLRVLQRERKQGCHFVKAEKEGVKVKMWFSFTPIAPLPEGVSA